MSGKTAILADRAGTTLEICADGIDGRFARELTVGANLRAYVHPDDRDIFDIMLRAAPGRPGREASIELRWSRGGDRWLPVLATFEAADKDKIGVTLRTNDVQTARRSEQQMRRVVEGSAQGIVVRTADRVLYMNQSFAELLGYSSPRECLESEPFIDSIIHPDDVKLVLRHLQARVTGKETVSHYEFRLLRRDRAIVWVETYAAMVNWDGKPASLSWLIDVSDRKHMEAELVRSKEEAEYANRTKTEFLANMSHELRTPLNAILGFSELMAQKLFGPISSKYVEYATDIHRSGRHLLELVNDVLDLAKLEAGKLELHETEIDLADLVEDAVKLVHKKAEDGNVRLGMKLSRDAVLLRADRRCVKQIVLNLLTNAIKFTPPGGAVVITADCDARGCVGVSIADTGIGMTEEEIEVALSPFGQIDSKLARNQEGTGLGLPICRSLLELHGGELLVASKPNCGTTMTARFPVVRTATRRQTVNS